MLIALITASLTVVSLTNCASIEDIPDEVLKRILTSFRSSNPKENSVKAPFSTCKRWRLVLTEYIESLEADCFRDENVMQQLHEFPVETNWNDAAKNGFIPSNDYNLFFTVPKDRHLLVDLWKVDCLPMKMRNQAIRHIESQWVTERTRLAMFKLIAFVLTYFSTTYLIGTRFTWLSVLAIPWLLLLLALVKQLSGKAPDLSFADSSISLIITLYLKPVEAHERACFALFLLYYMSVNVFWWIFLSWWDISNFADLNVHSILPCLLAFSGSSLTVAMTFFITICITPWNIPKALLVDSNLLLIAGISLLLERLLFSWLP